MNFSDSQSTVIQVPAARTSGFTLVRHDAQPKPILRQAQPELNLNVAKKVSPTNLRNHQDTVHNHQSSNATIANEHNHYQCEQSSVTGSTIRNHKGNHKGNHNHGSSPIGGYNLNHSMLSHSQSQDELEDPTYNPNPDDEEYYMKEEAEAEMEELEEEELP